MIETQVRKKQIKERENSDQLVSSPGDSKIGRDGLFNVLNTNEKKEKAEVRL